MSYSYFVSSPSLLLRRTGGVLTLAAALVGCGSTPDSDANNPDSNGGDGDSVEHDLNDLVPPSGASSTVSLSDGFCGAPLVNIDQYANITKASFREGLLDIPVGFLEPLHQAFLGVNEVNAFDSIFEVVMASYDTGCDWNADEDLDGWLPDDGELLEEGTAQDIREEVGSMIDDAVVLEEGGTTLRLSFHECSLCAEPIGATPQIITIRMSEDGWFEFNVELEEGEDWVKSALITPDGVFLQAPMAPASDWIEDFNEETREGDAVLPEVSGMLSLNMWKDDAGQVVSRFGLEQLEFDSVPGEPENVNVSAPGECLGITQTLDPETGVAQNNFYFGTVTTTVPGNLNCDTSDCDTKENQGAWRYQVGGLSGTATLPGPGEAEDFRTSIEFAGLNRMTLDDDLIGEVGLGAEGKGGFMSLAVDKQEDGYVVSFEPTLRMGGALAISNFSERFRMSLPDWLNDEIFDLTFGGDPVASVFVPAREECQYDEFGDRILMTEPERREVSIVTGTMTAVRASDTMTAQAGECVGKTLEPEASYSQTSDWVDMGFVCE